MEAYPFRLIGVGYSESQAGHVLILSARKVRNLRHAHYRRGWGRSRKAGTAPDCRSDHYAVPPLRV
jgi:hypothetical protein